MTQVALRTGINPRASDRAACAGGASNAPASRLAQPPREEPATTPSTRSLAIVPSLGRIVMKPAR